MVVTLPLNLILKESLLFMVTALERFAFVLGTELVLLFLSAFLQVGHHFIVRGVWSVFLCFL